MTDAETGRTRRRGRPALNRTTSLERDEIVDRAMATVQREGLDAISMRRLASDLGVTPAAIYHHIPDKRTLLSAMVERVWDLTRAAPPSRERDPIEALIESCVRIREVWLSYFDLASLAVAVASPDEEFYRQTRFLTTAFEVLGFPDVPLAHNAVQNFTMGSIEIAANRKAASLYFGRDPKAVRSRAQRLLNKHDASDNHHGVVEGRFDEGDSAYFEAALRALITGLLAGH
jgi:AcrR family transcriptional regulator